MIEKLELTATEQETIRQSRLQDELSHAKEIQSQRKDYQPGKLLCADSTGFTAWRPPVDCKEIIERGGQLILAIPTHLLKEETDTMPIEEIEVEGREQRI